MYACVLTCPIKRILIDCSLGLSVFDYDGSGGIETPTFQHLLLPVQIVNGKHMWNLAVFRHCLWDVNTIGFNLLQNLLTLCCQLTLQTFITDSESQPVVQHDRVICFVSG